MNAGLKKQLRTISPGQWVTFSYRALVTLGVIVLFLLHTVFATHAEVDQKIKVQADQAATATATLSSNLTAQNVSLVKGVSDQIAPLASLPPRVILLEAFVADHKAAAIEADKDMKRLIHDVAEVQGQMNLVIDNQQIVLKTLQELAPKSH